MMPMVLPVRRVTETRKKKKSPLDMEKLGESLVKLQEDDLLYVVQLIHDNKTNDTYTLNDPDGKKFLFKPEKQS